MKLAAAEAKIIEARRSMMGMSTICVEMSGEEHVFSIIVLASAPIVISTSIIDAMVSGDTDLAHELSAIFTSVYFLHREEIEEKLEA